jgi:hypothetical protein
LVATLTAENLTTDTAMMSTAESVESRATFIAFSTVVIRHPVLLEITIFVSFRCLELTVIMLVIVQTKLFSSSVLAVNYVIQVSKSIPFVLFNFI